MDAQQQLTPDALKEILNTLIYAPLDFTISIHFLERKHFMIGFIMLKNYFVVCFDP